MKNLLKYAYILVAAATITGGSVSANPEDVIAVNDQLPRINMYYESFFTSRETVFFSYLYSDTAINSLNECVAHFQLCSPEEQDTIRSAEICPQVCLYVKTARQMFSMDESNVNINRFKEAADAFLASFDQPQQ